MGRISLCAYCSNTFFPLGTHSWYVSHNVVGLWFDFVHVLLCSAAIRTITRNLLLSGQLQDETFLHSGQSLFLLKAVPGFVRKIFLCWLWTPFLIQRVSHKWLYHTARESSSPCSCLSSELSLVALTLIHGSLTLFDKDIKFDSVKA